MLFERFVWKVCVLLEVHVEKIFVCLFVFAPGSCDVANHMVRRYLAFLLSSRPTNLLSGDREAFEDHL